MVVVWKLPPDVNGVRQTLDIVEERLGKYGLKRKEITKAMLLTEEVMVSMMAHGDGQGQVHLSVRRLLGDIRIEISVPGEAYDFANELNVGAGVDAEDMSREAERSIRGIILKAYAEDVKYRNRNGVNSARLTVVRSKHAMLYRTLGAMLLAIALGLLMRAVVPESVNSAVNTNVLVPVKTMFMNALKMIVTPVVFFSIVSCIGQFGSLTEMGRVGGKTMAYYLLTTLIATLLGVGLFFLFRPGSPDMLAETATAGTAVGTMEISLIDTLVNIVPGNFLSPFLEADMLQLIFLAVLCGIAVGMIGPYSRVLTELFTACNELFLKITVLLVKFIPVAAFCSILSMMLKTGTEALLAVLSMFGVFLVAIAAMMVVYCLMMVVLARLNPRPFLRKYTPTMLQVFSMASSNAALPLNMEACGRKLGLSPKVYSLSLPLGATVNMDGSCLYQAIFALALARVYGVEITGAALVSVMISIVVLSIGAPGVPGSGMICLSVLLTQLGIPVEAVGLVMGIDPLVGMLRCMSNCLGDVAVSCIVARQERLMDMEIYNRES